MRCAAFGSGVLKLRTTLNDRAGRIARGVSYLRAASTGKPSHPTSDTNPEDLVGAGWDPEGLLPSPTSIAGGHFARRERQRNAQPKTAQAASDASSTGLDSTNASASSTESQSILSDLRPVAADHLANGGIRSSDRHLYDHDALKQKLKESCMPVDLQFPGLRILHFDPFICVVDAFWSSDQCNAFMQQVEASGQLQTSKVGAGNVYNTTMSAINNRRTSKSMLLDPAMEVAYPPLQEGVAQLRKPIWQLLCADAGKGWGKPGKMPLPKQYCFESLQVARYEAGQYFLSHEDAFPIRQAAENGFQRHATLLVYLNDVASGGATRFDYLGVSVQPKQGMALLFFPSRSDGTPDVRTLHTAMDAQDTKWIVQQWVARGWSAAAGGNLNSSTSELLRNAAMLQSVQLSGTLDWKTASSRERKRKQSKKAKKGFGA